MNVSRPGSWHISSIEPLDAESGILDQFLDRAIQVTAAGQVLPGWGEMILPPAHTRLWRAPMLDKQKTTSRFQYPTHLPERALDLGDAAASLRLPHGQMYQPRDDSFLIEAHCSANDVSLPDGSILQLA
jgi:hypothetical protein